MGAHISVDKLAKDLQSPCGEFWRLQICSSINMTLSPHFFLDLRPRYSARTLSSWKVKFKDFWLLTINNYLDKSPSWHPCFGQWNRMIWFFTRNTWPYTLVYTSSSRQRKRNCRMKVNIEGYNDRLHQHHVQFLASSINSIIEAASTISHSWYRSLIHENSLAIGLTGTVVSSSPSQGQSQDSLLAVYTWTVVLMISPTHHRSPSYYHHRLYYPVCVDRNLLPDWILT